MRGYWIVTILAILVGLGLLMVVQSQYQVKNMMNKKTERLKMELERLSNEYLSKDLFKVSVKSVVLRGQEAVDDLEAAINKLSSEMEQKQTENNACQGEMKTIKEELEHTLKTYSETKASLDAEVEAWTQEIKTLKETLTGYNPICDYVKKNTLSQRLCVNTTLAERDSPNETETQKG